MIKIQTAYLSNPKLLSSSSDQTRPTHVSLKQINGLASKGKQITIKYNYFEYQLNHNCFKLKGKENKIIQISILIGLIDVILLKL